jgi:hypothetical protein
VPGNSGDQRDACPENKTDRDVARAGFGKLGPIETNRLAIIVEEHIAVHR